MPQQSEDRDRNEAKLPPATATAVSPAGAESLRLRTPCKYCGSVDGTVEWDKNGQDVVSCAICRRYAYNAPRSETGRRARTVRTRPSLRPKQRSRIFARDLARCVLCKTDEPKRIDIGHLLSVHDGRVLGVSDELLWSDDNLAVMCAECNDWLGADSVAPLLLALILLARSLRKRNATAA